MAAFLVLIPPQLPFGTPEGAKMVGSTACGAVSNMEGASEKVPIPVRAGVGIALLGHGHVLLARPGM
ncbi:hypothetical protein WJX74_000730 [Apatococcus lobatus]|uniref:Uncharacterized protein n=1 Tax=Apatococcus lobatus TaxID=904363 RepID=A0AAW1PZD5_9CHLO